MRFLVVFDHAGRLHVYRCTPENLRRLARAALRADGGRLTPAERAELVRCERDDADPLPTVRRLVCGPKRGFACDVVDLRDGYQDHLPG